MRYYPKIQSVLIVCVILFWVLSGCSENRQKATVGSKKVEETVTESSESPPSILYYDKENSYPVNMTGLAITRQTKSQVIGSLTEIGDIDQYIEERLCDHKEIQNNYFEITLNENLDETISYTLWCIFQPERMYSFDNVFLQSGDKLSFYYEKENGIFLMVEHSNGEKRAYRAKLVSIA